MYRKVINCCIIDISDACGVIHIHEHPRVVGASRVEDHMTRCAMQDVFENQANTQDYAVDCQPLSQVKN